MRYAIIGSSAAGISAVEAIRSKDKKSDITVISDEKKPLYSRCLISYLLAGTIDKDKIWIRPDDFFKKNKAEAILGVRAEKIDLKNREVYLKNKEKVKFNKLLIATGSSPKIDDVPGNDKKGVFPLRTLAHAVQIQAALDKVKSVAVLGGGLIGLRAAYALRSRGKDVSIFVRSPQILSQIIDEESAGIMQRHIEKKGIKIFTGRYAREIKGKLSVEGLALDNGSDVDCQLVVVGKGVSPNIEIAKEAGLETNWGIVVDSSLRAGSKDVFAAGDVVEGHDIALEENTINAIWPVACEQGRIAGLNMSGEDQVYDGTLAMNSIEFFGLSVISIGITKPKKAIYKEIVKKDLSNNKYKKIVLRDDVIVGAIFVNAIENIGVIGALIKNKVNVKDIKDIALENYFDYGRIIKIIKDSKDGFREKEFRETILTL
ncbi:MAG: FAD-dependent oxidoreductase [Candidatus Omnitrophica bacterium]|nr:FAD-dependent oxidoreductase [Candidatus Omnitrophota bacterium]MBU1932790.1 FAD-dependent oxidoreductase [Candidatus Omnitrophota bacterium]